MYPVKLTLWHLRLFNRVNHYVWYNLYRHQNAKRKTVVQYIYGNLLVANTMMTHSFVTGLHVPTNLLVISDEESTCKASTD